MRIKSSLTLITSKNFTSFFLTEYPRNEFRGYKIGHAYGIEVGISRMPKTSASRHGRYCCPGFQSWELFHAGENSNSGSPRSTACPTLTFISLIMAS